MGVADRIRYALKTASITRISWTRDGNKVGATIEGSGQHIADAVQMALRAADHLATIADAHDRVKRAREELAAAEADLALAFDALDYERSGL